MSLKTKVQALRERARPRWPAVRAVLIGYHLIAVFLLSIPSPAGVMDRSAWANATVQNEFKQWASRLTSLGVETDAARLEDAAWRAGNAYLGAREVVIFPFEPYGMYSGAYQNWPMFTAPQRYPVRLHIDVKEGGKWRTVYVERSTEHRWNADLFDAYRMRRVLFMTGWEREQRSFRGLCDFLADRAKRDFVGASEIRFRHFEYRTPTPEEAIAGKKDLEGRFRSKEQRSLGGQLPSGEGP